MYKAKVIVTIRETILDPQGKAVEHSLQELGYGKVVDTRIGKYIEMKIDTNDREEAERITKETAGKLLANPIMEDFSYELLNEKEEVNV
jgi:phosphoribosylformylglycinamidine synthase PurS subunit